VQTTSNRPLASQVCTQGMSQDLVNSMIRWLGIKGSHLTARHSEVT